MSYLSRIVRNYSLSELSSEELAYYARHILLPGLGVIGQRKLKTARVLVVGAGGLGCPVLQALAGAGVGRLSVVDGDSVGISNLSRQWLHRYADSGYNKAKSAAASLRELNPFIETVGHPNMFTAENAKALVDSHDLVIDATDDLDARYWIDDACAALGRPWVHAALYRERAQLTVFWAHCGATFRKLYPEPSEAPACSETGMLGATASVIGNLQALEAIKLITGSSAPKIGQLVSFDGQGLNMQSFQIPGVTLPTRLPDAESQASTYGLSLESLQQARSIHEPMLLLDLRSRTQFEAGTLPGAIHYPAERILEEGLPARVNGKVVLLCEEGMVSSMVAEALSSTNTPIYYLESGLVGV